MGCARECPGEEGQSDIQGFLLPTNECCCYRWGVEQQQQQNANVVGTGMSHLIVETGIRSFFGYLAIKFLNLCKCKPPRSSSGGSRGSATTRRTIHQRSTNDPPPSRGAHHGDGFQLSWWNWESGANNNEVVGRISTRKTHQSAFYFYFSIIINYVLSINEKNGWKWWSLYRSTSTKLFTNPTTSPHVVHWRPPNLLASERSPPFSIPYVEGGQGEKQVWIYHNRYSVTIHWTIPLIWCPGLPSFVVGFKPSHAAFHSLERFIVSPRGKSSSPTACHDAWFPLFSTFAYLPIKGPFR